MFSKLLSKYRQKPAQSITSGAHSHWLAKPLKSLQKSTGLRLTLWYSAIFIFSSLLLFGLAYFLLSTSIEAKDHEIIQAKIDEYAYQYRSDGLDGLLKELHREQPTNEQAGLFVWLGAPDGRTLFVSLPHGRGKRDFEQQARAPEIGDRDRWAAAKDEEHEDPLEVTSCTLPGGTILQVGKSSKDANELMERFREIFAGIMLPVVLIGFIGGSFLAFRALRPVRDLITTVRSIDTGKMDARVPSRQTGDELEELVELFNNMLEKIQTLIAGMSAALDNVAHDLRTPVTRMRGVVETVLQSGSDAETLREALMDCAEESEKIATMLNILMDISEAETGVMRLRLEPVDLSRIVADVVELYQYVSEEKGISITTELPEDLTADADPDRIRQVIANLLDNAVKYTPEGGRVALKATRKGDQIVILVEDTGMGIAPDDLPKIYDRLFRGDRSRSHRGLGLGLSLVQAVMRAHNGRVEVKSRPGEGSRFSLFFPAGTDNRRS